MKQFNHSLTTISEEAVQINEPGKRLYQTPYGHIYPSITTVLSIMKEEVLAKWRKRVGDKEADAKSKWGRERGTLLHEALEQVLKNQKPICSMTIGILVQDLLPFVNKIDNIHCQEQVLYSDKFRIGGTCDAIAEYNGKLSVIDFKGSGRQKPKEYIEDYFMQASFYGFAFYERTKIVVPQCVVLIATETGDPQEFIEQPYKWWERLKDVRKDYETRYGV